MISVRAFSMRCSDTYSRLTPFNTFIRGLREKIVFIQIKFTGHTTDERVNDDGDRLTYRVICFAW